MKALLAWRARTSASGNRAGRQRAVAMALAGLAALVAGCQSLGLPLPGGTVDTTVTGALGVADIRPAAPAEAVRAVSAYRTSRRRPPVLVSQALNRAARAYARKLARAGRLTHTLNGSTLPGRLAAVGYEWQSAAENLGAGYRSLDDAMHGWKTSRAGHNEILLRRDVTELGFAMVTTGKGRYRSYWVLILASPAEPGDRRRWIRIR